MTQSRNAVSNLISRYRAVLKKCGILNTFGTLAVAGMLVMGSVGGAVAADVTDTTVTDTVYGTTVNNKVVKIVYQNDCIDKNKNLISSSNVTFAETTGVTVNLTDKIFDGVTGQAGTSRGVLQNMVKVGAGAGAADVVSGNLNITKGTFQNNKATNAGGAVTIWTNANTTGIVANSVIDGTTFTKNTATSGGGALAIMGQASLESNVNGAVEVKNATFTENSAAQGGAIWNQTNLTDNGSTFSKNTAGTDAIATGNAKSGSKVANVDGKGGAVYIDTGSTNTFTSTTFENNQALGANGIGGAVFIAKNAGATTFTNCAFTGNSATGSAGAVEARGNVTFSNVDFDNNTAGKDNKQGGWGGAIRTVSGANVMFNVTEDLEYTGNKANVTENVNGYTDRGGFLDFHAAGTVGFDIADGKTLTIGSATEAKKTVDSIVSGHGSDTVINKTGDGTLTVNGSMKSYTGAINVNAGTLNMATGFGEFSNGVQARLNAGVIGNSVHFNTNGFFGASTMKIGTDDNAATVNMGDLNINFTQIKGNTSDGKTGTAVSSAGIIIDVNKGSFTADNVTVGKQDYKNGSDDIAHTTTGWGEFYIADKAKAEIASLTVKDGGKFDKTGAGALTVTGDISVQNGSETASGLAVTGGTLTADKLVLGARVEGEDEHKGFVTVSDGALLTVDEFTSVAGKLALDSSGTFTINNGWEMTPTGQAALDMKGGKFVVLGSGFDMSEYIDKGDDTKIGNGGAISELTEIKDLTTTKLTLGDQYALKLDGAGSVDETVTFLGGKDGKFLDAASLDINSSSKTIAVNLGSTAYETKGGSFDGTVKVTDGALNVVKGNWELANLVTTATNGLVDVSGGKLTLNKLTSAVDTITVAGGVLAGKATVFVQDDGNDSYKKAEGVAENSLALGATGTVELDWAAGTELSKTQLADIKGVLDSDGTGVILHKNAKITIADTDIIKDNENLNGSIDVAEAGGYGNTLLKGHTVGVKAAAAANLGNAFAADALKVDTTGAVADFALTLATGVTTLTGEGKDLVNKVGENTDQKVTLAVATNTLNLGNAAVSAGSGSVDGISVGTGSVNAVNGSYNVGKLEMTAAAGGGSVNINGGGVVTVETLDTSEATGANTINVGSTDGGKGTLYADNVVLNANTVVTYDPAFDTTPTLDEATVSGSKFKGDAITGKQFIKENSLVVFGDNDAEGTAWLQGNVQNLIDRGAIKWGDKTDAKGVTAVLGIRGAHTLTDSITVDGVGGAIADTAKSATFRANSLLVVDVDSLKTSGTLADNATAITGVTTLAIDDDAKLLFTDAKVGDKLNVTDRDDATSAAKRFAAANMFSSNIMQKVTLDTSATANKYEVSEVKAATAFAGTALSSEMGGLLDGLNKKSLLGDTEHENASLRFLSRSSDVRFASATEGAKNIETAARASVAGGVANVATDAASLASSAAGNRVSMAAPIVATSGAVEKETAQGVGVWFMPLYQSNDVNGMEAGNMEGGFTSDVYGGALGMDYTLANGLRIGMSANMGTGESDSQGDFNKTSTDSDFFGASLYAGYRFGNFGVSADLGYTKTDAEIDIEMPSSLGMGNFEANVDSDIITLGARGEYKIATGAVDLIPHAGLRYTHYEQDSYSVESTAGTVFSVDEADMDIWQLPIGISVSKAFANGAWTFQPRADLSYIYAFGDTEIDLTNSIPGVATSASLESEVFDEHTFEIGLGLDSKYGDAWTLGLDYTYQGSENRDAHGVYGTVRFEF